MNALTVIITIAVLSLIAPFVFRIHKSAQVWITLIIVNLIIASLYVIVKDSSPEVLRPRPEATVAAD